MEELLTKYKQTDLDFGINKDVFKELVGDAVDDATAEAIVSGLGSGKGVYVTSITPPRPCMSLHLIPWFCMCCTCLLYQHVRLELHLWRCPYIHGLRR